MDIENRYGTLSAQRGLLELLKAFHSFCVAKGVRYSLAYGSLLGAIRHGGFIPWDDDLDVFVDRENYDRLVLLLKEDPTLQVDRDSVRSLWVDRVRMKDISSNRGSYAPTLDLLVLDKLPAKDGTRRIQLFLILLLQGMIKPRLNLSKGSWVMKACSIATFLLGKLFPIRLKKDWYRKVSQMGKGDKSAFVCNLNGEYSDLRRRYPADLMEHIVEHGFEDTKAYIVEAYDMCLTTQFGDYMKLPDESDRKPSHGGGA